MVGSADKETHRVIHPGEQPQILDDGNQLCGNGVNPQRCHHKAPGCHNCCSQREVQTTAPLLIRLCNTQRLAVKSQGSRCCILGLCTETDDLDCIHSADTVHIDFQGYDAKP